MKTEAELLQALATASTFQEQSRLVAELDQVRAVTAARLEDDRSLQMSASIVDHTLTPVRVHERHTAATDWLGTVQASVDSGEVQQRVVAEASLWYQGLDPMVKGDREEFGEQARGMARRTASMIGGQLDADVPALAEGFLQYVSFLHSREAASGLPQVQQLVSPDGSSYAPTEMPQDTFDTFQPPVAPENEGVDEMQSTENAQNFQEKVQPGMGGSGPAEVSDNHGLVPVSPSDDDDLEGPGGGPLEGNGARASRREQVWAEDPIGRPTLAVNAAFNLDQFREAQAREAAVRAAQPQQTRQPRTARRQRQVVAEVEKEGSSQLPQVQQVWDADGNYAPQPLNDEVAFPLQGEFGEEESTDSIPGYRNPDAYGRSQAGGQNYDNASTPPRQASRQCSCKCGCTKGSDGKQECKSCRTAGHHGGKTAHTGPDDPSFVPGGHMEPMHVRPGETAEDAHERFHDDRHQFNEMTGQPHFPSDVTHHENKNFSDHDKEWLRNNGFEARRAQASRKTADMYGNSDAPHQTLAPVPNGAAEVPQTGTGFARGQQAGAADAAANERPTYADAGARNEPFQQGYSKGYSENRGGDQFPKDLPGSLQPGIPNNDANFQQAPQMTDSEVTAVLRREASRTRQGVSDWNKGFAYAAKWTPRTRHVSTGTPEFEAGLYAGMSQNRNRGAFVQASLAKAQRYPALGKRVALHKAFTQRTAAHPHSDNFFGDQDREKSWAQNKPRSIDQGFSSGGTDPRSKDNHGAHPGVAVGESYQPAGAEYYASNPGSFMQGREQGHGSKENFGAHGSKQAATSTDLDTMSPDASPNPGGSTPINGPGTPPPGSLDGLPPGAPGGAPPYNGAPPFGAPVAPDPGLPNNPRAAAFRTRVQAGLAAQSR